MLVTKVVRVARTNNVNYDITNTINCSNTALDPCRVSSVTLSARFHCCNLQSPEAVPLALMDDLADRWWLSHVHRWYSTIYGYFLTCAQ